MQLLKELTLESLEASQYEHLTLEVSQHVATVTLSRPDKANALNMQLWAEIGQVFEAIDQVADIRVVILAGEGKHFCGGIDLAEFSAIFTAKRDCEGRFRERLRRQILAMQDSFTAIERCRVPVIAAVHGAVIGGAIDMITCCDMRYASCDAKFSIREIDIGMTADVGTLQRLPKIIPDGIMRELAYTGREFGAEEARTMGLVNSIAKDKPALDMLVGELATEIASKAPLAIRGTKEMILFSRDHSVEEGLNYIATWNSAMILSDDIQQAMKSRMTKQTPEFKN
ncbi:crotonase/enoyl-CoA hydratase family protein [Allohahella marinimesophila]|uniref:Crotonase/enoyl-CoA hydratase family protein n=1 Tax=Allohahella marinimesophila TaxID=1054972 RepID=A0ABP7PR30_9GAMM